MSGLISEKGVSKCGTGGLRVANICIVQSVKALIGCHSNFMNTDSAFLHTWGPIIITMEATKKPGHVCRSF